MFFDDCKGNDFTFTVGKEIGYFVFCAEKAVPDRMLFDRADPERPVEIFNFVEFFRSESGCESGFHWKISDNLCLTIPMRSSSENPVKDFKTYAENPERPAVDHISLMDFIHVNKGCSVRNDPPVFAGLNACRQPEPGYPFIMA